MTTTDSISGKNLEMLGLVQGNIVRTKNIGKSIVAGFRAMAGGEVSIFTNLLNEAREIAIKRMQDQAKALGADAIVCVRIATCSVMDGSSEVTAYGTAVKYI
jgi:uncharacterized protein YbjQ (UPF0145 family)